jgi:hypothetical protein
VPITPIIIMWINLPAKLIALGHIILVIRLGRTRFAIGLERTTLGEHIEWEPIGFKLGLRGRIRLGSTRRELRSKREARRTRTSTLASKPVGQTRAERRVTNITEQN